LRLRPFVLCLFLCRGGDGQAQRILDGRRCGDPNRATAQLPRHHRRDLGRTGNVASAAISVFASDPSADSITVYNLDPGVEADHNVGIAPTGGGAVFSWSVDGVTAYYGSPGTYGNANIIVAGGPAAEFGAGFDPSTLSYDVMLIAGAPAIGKGTTTGAPSVDILGVAQPTSYGESAGAYGYPQ
jgi:hypothetical protein